MSDAWIHPITSWIGCWAMLNAECAVRESLTCSRTRTWEPGNLGTWEGSDLAPRWHLVCACRAGCKTYTFLPLRFCEILYSPGIPGRNWSGGLVTGHHQLYTTIYHECTSHKWYYMLEGIKTVFRKIEQQLCLNQSSLTCLNRAGAPKLHRLPLNRSEPFGGMLGTKIRNSSQ